MSRSSRVPARQPGRASAPPVRRVITVLVVAAWSSLTAGADWPQWGRKYSRNMVSGEKNLPQTFDIETGKNVKWSTPLGSESYATPVIAGGRVYIGTNNAVPRDPRHEGIRGILLCLDEATGKLIWQLVVPKFQDDRFLDWPRAGICSPATVEGDRIYVVSNRAEVMCLDVKGQSNGNDGPFRDEGRLMALREEEPLKVTGMDADVLWIFDMPKEIGMNHHDAAHSAILVDGDYLYLNTGNGVDKRHSKIPCPDAPSLIVLDKRTGRLVAQDGERIGERIFHCTWSPPALGVVGGRRLIFFCGGDGVTYAFQALEPGVAPAKPPRTLERVWRFDCDPTAPKENVHDYIGNRRVSPSNIKSTPVFFENRLYVTVGGDIWWGKNKCWLQCIDASKTGEITKTGLVWSYPMKRHCCTTPAIYRGLAFAGDLGKTLHCVDIETGKACWTHTTRGEIWSSALVADGKVYVGTRRGEFFILAASRTKKLIASLELDGPLFATPVAANGVLYIATMHTLYAIQSGTASKPNP